MKFFLLTDWFFRWMFSIQPIGQHFPLALHLHLASFGHDESTECIENLLGRVTNVDLKRLAIRLHSWCGIHSIAEQAVPGHLKTDDSGHARSWNMKFVTFWYKKNNCVYLSANQYAISVVRSVDGEFGIYELYPTKPRPFGQFLWRANYRSEPEARIRPYTRRRSFRPRIKG